MKNHYDQPIGNPVHGWVTREIPIKKMLEGRYCYLECVIPEKHFEDLYEVYGPKSATKNWTYLPLDKFEDPADFSAYLETVSRSKDPLHYAIIDKVTQKALGTLALMRTNPEQGTIEVGFVIYSDRLKKTRIATEAQYLAAS